MISFSWLIQFAGSTNFAVKSSREPPAPVKPTESEQERDGILFSLDTSRCQHGCPCRCVFKKVKASGLLWHMKSSHGHCRWTIEMWIRMCRPYLTHPYTCLEIKMVAGDVACMSFLRWIKIIPFLIRRALPIDTYLHRQNILPLTKRKCQTIHLVNY